MSAENKLPEHIIKGLGEDLSGVPVNDNTDREDSNESPKTDPQSIHGDEQLE